MSKAEVRSSYLVLKRAYDIAGSVLGLIILGPIGLLIAIAIKLSDGGPVFYRQRRVGQQGVDFRAQDARITRIGRILRRTKIDELPQLWNVLMGEMSFVGPRPEVPRYVDRYTREQRQLLSFRPGITDLATLVFRDEETLLRHAVDVEAFYIEHCIPRKFHLNMQYARQANLWRDTVIILRTLCPYWLGIGGAYGLLLSVSLYLAYQLRFDFAVPPNELSVLLQTGPFFVALQLVALYWWRQFKGLLSFFGPAEIQQLGFALAAAAGMQYLLWIFSQGRWMAPRSVIVTDWCIAFLMIVVARTSLRSLHELQARRRSKPHVPGTSIRVGLVGAGNTGAWLINEINRKQQGSHKVEVVFDDDPSKWHRQIHGIPVVGMPECILDGSWRDRLDEVIVAAGDANPERVEQIKAILEGANIRARLIPSLREILSDIRLPNAGPNIP